MSRLQWDQIGGRLFEVGVSHGVLYPVPHDYNIPRSRPMVYDKGVAWNGLTDVEVRFDNAEFEPMYMDGVRFLQVAQKTEFSATLKAYTYPDAFELYSLDGTFPLIPGSLNTPEYRHHPFGLSWRTRIGNDVEGIDHAFRVHLLYSAFATPTTKSWKTFGSTIDPNIFSWELRSIQSTFSFGDMMFSYYTIDSRKVAPSKMVNLENVLYGTESTDPALPSISAVMALIS